MSILKNTTFQSVYGRKKKTETDLRGREGKICSEESCQVDDKIKIGFQQAYHFKPSQS